MGNKLDSRVEKLERSMAAQAAPRGVILYDAVTGEPRPGGNAADLIRAWRDGVTTLWLPDNGRDDLQAESE